MIDPENILPFPNVKEIEAQAAQWIVQLEEGDLSAEETARFLAWRNASEHHREIFAAMLNLWSDLDILEELRDYAEAVKHDESDRQTPQGRRISGISRRAALSGLAATVACAAVVVGWVRFAPSFHNPDSGIYETAVGEQKKIVLADGSVIELNTNSLVGVAYESQARNISLIRGEAHFEVAPDRDRPFSVTASRNRVTAVGTAFSVHLTDNSQVEVVVAHGKVELAALSDSGPAKKHQTKSEEAKPLVEMTVGQKAIADDRLEMLEELDPQQLSRALSWRQGVLAFAGEPLGEVVSDIARYTDTIIEIQDDALRNMPVAGYFRVGEIDAMLEALEVMTDIRVERVNNDYVRISSARPG